MLFTISKKEKNDEDTIVNLHGQTFKLKGLGKFNVFFIDPKYRFETKFLYIYYGEKD